jgi:iron complex transport system ATP-binding protein
VTAVVSTIAPALAVHGVSVSLGGQPVLHDVSLAVRPGEWLAVVGPNGSGKTTLLRVIAGSLRSATGLVELGGQDARTLRRRLRAQQFALVPQTPIIPPGMTASEYVLLGRTPFLHPLAQEGARDLAAAAEAMARLELHDFVDRELMSMSGGERQRVFLARALAQGAPILLLDEPTTALDVGHQQQVLDLVDELRSHHDLTVVSTLHDLTLAAQYADRLVLLDRGRVVVEGTATDVLTEEHLARYYGARVHVVQDADGRPAVLPYRAPRPEEERS